MVITSFTTLANGISDYAGQNLGAGKLPRVRQGFRAGVGMVWMICVPVASLYFFAGKYLVLLFMDSGAQMAVATGMQFLCIVAPFYFVVSVKLVADGILRGVGLMKQFMAGTFTDLILRVVLAIILAKRIGSLGIWLSWPVGWSISMVMSVLFYRSFIRQKKAF